LGRIPYKTKAVLCITLDGGLLKAIDRVRGPINRSNFIQFLIEEALKAYEARRSAAEGQK
jgi:metal-responsive CopG/Arc/MetJ family transcriptional regulator